jgi:hypothetical protein
MRAMTVVRAAFCENAALDSGTQSDKESKAATTGRVTSA